MRLNEETSVAGGWVGSLAVSAVVQTPPLMPCVRAPACPAALVLASGVPPCHT